MVNDDGWWLSHLPYMWWLHGLIWCKIPLMIILSYLAGWWFQPTPLKNMSSSDGMMRFPIDGKIKFMFQTTNQINIWVWTYCGWLRNPVPPKRLVETLFAGMFPTVFNWWFGFRHHPIIHCSVPKLAKSLYFLGGCHKLCHKKSIRFFGAKFLSLQLFGKLSP